MASTYATFTNNTVPSTSKFTWSAWVKRGKLGTQQSLFSGAQSSTTGQMIYFNGAADQLGFYGIASSTVRVDKYTTMKFRDVNAWYHIVVAYDSTLSTASDRVKFYVNGELQQLNGTDVQVQGWEPYYMLTSPTDIGRDAMGTSSYFDGEISHMNFVIGTVYDASAFGETDSTTGEWKIKTSPSVTYGSDGFFVLKDGNSLTDQSGNSNNFTVGGGTLTKTEDSPSNVFATFNPLIYNGAQANYNPLFSNGNTTTASNTSVNAFSNARATLAMTSGKYYAEFKTTSSDSNMQIGLINYQSGFRSTNNWGLNYQNDGAVSFEANGGIYINNSLSGTSFSGFTTGDIMQVAFDRTSEKVWLGKNGTWFNSGDPANGTNELLDLSSTINNDEFWTFAVGFYHSVNEVWEANFGNGYFGTTAVSSAGTNASGIGIFEFDCPVGYTALSTKGLNL
jgi:hypothetical protein